MYKLENCTGMNFSLRPQLFLQPLSHPQLPPCNLENNCSRPHLSPLLLVLSLKLVVLNSHPVACALIPDLSLTILKSYICYEFLTELVIFSRSVFKYNQQQCIRRQLESVTSIGWATLKNISFCQFMSSGCTQPESRCSTSSVRKSVSFLTY